jgi:hypothetical protein
VSGCRLASSPFSWCWCRCGECDTRGVAVGVRVMTRRVSCRHCVCVAVVCDAGRCSCCSSDSTSRRGEWCLRPVRRCLACVVTCGVADVLLLSQTHPPATTAPATAAGAAAAAVCVLPLLPLLLPIACVTSPSVLSPLLFAPQQATLARAGAGDATAATVSRAPLLSWRRVC